MSVSEKYHKRNNLQVVVTSKLLETAKSQLEKKNLKDVKLIDIGTGDGRVLIEVFVKLSEIKFSKIIGSDRREEVIDFAQKLYGNEILQFEILDIEHGSEENFSKILQNDRFDLATSFFALHYVCDFAKTFRNINKLLKTGGSFYFNFIHTSTVNEILIELAEKYPEQKDEIVSCLLISNRAKSFRESFPELLNTCGFSIDFLNYEEHSFDFGTEQAMKDQLSVAFTFCHEMNENLLLKFMDDFASINDRISKETGKGPSVLPHTYVHGLITKKF